MKSKLNKAWHEAHRMPEHPNIDERIAWHIEHQKHCKCREIPKKLKEEMLKLGIKLND